MRNLLMIASAAALAVSMPAFAKEKGGGKGGGGGQAAQGHKPDKGHGGGGGGHGGGKAMKAHKGGGGFERQEAKTERKFHKQEAKAERGWAKADAKADKGWRKAEAKAEKQWAKQDKRIAKEDRRFADSERRFDDGRFDDERGLFGDDRRFAGMNGCPPGLAKKGNGCMPPGQANKAFRVGELLPAAYFPSYNLPDQYRDWYQDNPDYSYRYDDGNIFRIDNRTNLISSLIPLLGGGLSVGNVLPSGFDAYNLPMQYRDDYQDGPESLYRYGDNAIYQVDPHSQMIEAVVALLAGNLNVGQVLPSGYDAYNLPMQYRDQYVDSDDAMYRYADGNIYQVDPQSRMIEQIVAMLG
jgi:hypothetical protein